MKLHELTPPPGSHRRGDVGRGARLGPAVGRPRAKGRRARTSVGRRGVHPTSRRPAPLVRKALPSRVQQPVTRGLRPVNLRDLARFDDGAIC